MPAIRALPGIEAVAAVNSAPMTLGATEHSRFATRFGIEGRSFSSGGYPVAQNRWLTPEYFSALGIPLQQGRLLSESDRGKPRIVVNQTLAQRYFPGQEAVGKRVVFGVMDPKQDLQEIVGVVGDVRDLGLDQPVEPTIYEVGASPVMTLVVRTSGGQAVESALRQAIHRLDPEIPVPPMQVLQQNVSDSLASRRFTLLLLSLFAGMAAFLAAGGIYGLLTQSVNARVREFGVRAALGAAPADLVRMVLLQAVVLAGPGLAAGALLSLSFARAMKSVVYQFSPADPLTIAAASLFLLFLTFCSAWLPARRAAAMDPAGALRRA